MILATVDSSVYKLVLLLHVATVVVGFGSSFVWPAMATKARKLKGREGYAITHAGLEVSRVLTTPFIYAAGALGVVLIPLSGEAWEFSQSWISASFTVFIIVALVGAFAHAPNLKAMDELSRTLAEGTHTPTQGGPPPEVAELEARAKKAGMFGGILHLGWLILMYLMIFKPGM
jgi:hypothetical protein